MLPLPQFLPPKAARKPQTSKRNFYVGIGIFHVGIGIFHVGKGTFHVEEKNFSEAGSPCATRLSGLFAPARKILIYNQ